jgi:hypothetical protein
MLLIKVNYNKLSILSVVRGTNSTHGRVAVFAAKEADTSPQVLTSVDA